MTPRAQAALGLALSVVLLALPLATTLLAPLEAVASVAYAWSVWLLARNHPLGWWVGLVGVSAYAVVFFEARLLAEVGLQAVYFVTSLQAIWLWLRGGPARTERPVSSLPAWWWAATLFVVAVATWALYEVLVHLRGEVPFWDALTTVLSLVAHVYLMGRYVQSWYVWIVVDTIYVPLYASRGLYLTSALYVGFWVLALGGLITFRRLLAERAQA